MLDNGKYLEVEKTNIETTSIGIITRHNYGISHSFTYDIFIKADQIEWKGICNREPKNIIFCQDTVYVRYLSEQSKRVEIIDSVTQDTTTNY